MPNLDARFVRIRGPITDNGQGVVSQARIFTHNGRLYIAESRNRGRTVHKVTSYDLPEGEPRLSGRTGVWGPFSWSGCGCSSQWSKWSTTGLAEMAGAHA